MLTYFPRYFSTRAIICYVVTLVLVSAFFMSHALPFLYMLFGLIPVIIFFTYSTQLTMQWQTCGTGPFTKKLFTTALILRVISVFVIYFFYMSYNGSPFKFGTGDDLFYAYVAAYWHDRGFQEMARVMSESIDLSDSGYPWWLGFECLLFGTHVLSHRLIKCFIDAFSCVLIYHLAKRNFGESTGRMAAIFCMLMPNMWYYCGVTLKETEMAFLTILFVERADAAIHSPKITFGNIILPGVVILVMFTFRTAMAAVLMAALAGALILSSGKQIQLWKKIVYVSVFVLWMFMTVGAEMIQETVAMWAARTDANYEWRAGGMNGNAFAKYAGASVFAPLIFTIPFSSMVNIATQENQMLMNGANLIKNIMSGFTVLALFMLLFRGDWRKHVLPIAVMCGYLVVLVFSNFAHSERFHFPILALELMFAAYGVSQVTNKHKRWYTIWLVGICIANIAWAWFKLAGRGMA
jgi:hypothetical protein